MAEPTIEALSGEEVLHSGLRVTVTPNYVVVRSSYGQKHIIIPLTCLTEVKLLKTTHNSLLVISGGLFVVAAAAFSSKEGNGAGWPIALLASGILLSYFGTRRASVAFIAGSEPTVSGVGSLKQVTHLIRAVQLKRPELTVGDIGTSKLQPVSSLFKQRSANKPARREASKKKVRLILRWRW